MVGVYGVEGLGARVSKIDRPVAKTLAASFIVLSKVA